LGFWHNFGEGTPYETSRQIALYAFDHGVTHFDLANNYGPEPGDAERRLGRLLREDLHSYRDELFISTKAAYDMWEGPYGSWASRKHMMASLDQSLSRMGLDYVDLFYCHRFDPETPLEESLQCLVDVVRSGKALYIGISRWPLEALQVAIPYLKERDVPLLIYQGRYNLLDREPETEGILDCLRENQIGFISFSPLAQGLLTDRYLNGIPAGSRMTENRFLKKEVLDDVLLNRLRLLNEMALQRGETLAQMALAWILNHPATTSVLVGASSVNQMEKNLCCMHSSPFSKEELHQVETILSGH
jgi:L-glyceraldehyde 3-phosphate reductase